MINFISAATIELMMALFLVNKKLMDFMMMLLFISLIGSTKYEPKLHSVN